MLEPQAQIIWQEVSFNTANDGLGSVALGSTSGWTGRLGLRGQWTITGQNVPVWQPYVGVNFWQDWGAQATTTFLPLDQVPLINEATRTEFLGGVTAKLDARLSVYAQGSYQLAIAPLNEGISRNGFQARHRVSLHLVSSSQPPNAEVAICNSGTKRATIQKRL